MRLLSERLKSIAPIISDLRIFFVALIKKWLFWLTLLVEGVSLIAQYINPKFQLHQAFYIGFAVIGFAWSAFEVYRDLLSTYRKSIPIVKEPISELSISFVEGNEYAFSIFHPYDGQEYFIERTKKENQVK
jgi:hypothetical protein